MKKWLNDNWGIILIWILAAMPIAIWIFMLPLVGRFASPFMIFRSSGQITGLFGMALLSINFILAARFSFLDKWFNGLNRVYVKHHSIGVIAFCFLLFHPTFLLIQYLFISLHAAFVFLLPGDFYVDLGKIALAIFIILMVITLYLHFKYQNWKNTHKFLGLVLIIAIAHMLYVPSDISNNAALRYYMIFLVVLSLISYFYRTIFKIYKKENTL
jgi:predicted ferric reductase